MGHVMKRKETGSKRQPASRQLRRLPEDNGELKSGIDTADSPFGLPWIEGQSAWIRWALPSLAAVALLGIGVLIWVQLRSSLAENSYRQPRQLILAGESKGSSSADRGSNGAGARSAPVVWLDEPDKRSVHSGKLGSVDRQVPSMLVHKKAATPELEGWERIEPDAPVATADLLMALPGFRANLVLDKGVDLYLWGSIPFFLLPRPVLETAVVLNYNRAYDLDFILLRGRVVLTNRKEQGPARVRVRFYHEKDKQEIWDITLHPGAEVALEKIGERNDDFDRNPNNNVSPLTLLSLAALKGEANVSVDESHVLSVQGDMAGDRQPLAAQITWDNRSGQKIQGPLDPDARKDWDRAMPASNVTQEMTTACRDLDKSFSGKSLGTALREAANDTRPSSRILAVDCLGAIDDLPDLLDVLGDCKDSQIEKCVAAFVTLHSWLGRNGQNDLKLYDTLLKRNFKEAEAVAIIQLLHGLSGERRRDPLTWELLIRDLAHPNPTLCYLAYHHLYQAVPEGRDIPYSPAGDAAQKKVAMAAWKNVIPDGKLPPGQ